MLPYVQAVDDMIESDLVIKFRKWLIIYIAMPYPSLFHIKEPYRVFVPPVTLGQQLLLWPAAISPSPLFPSGVNLRTEILQDSPKNLPACAVDDTFMHATG